MLLLAAGEISDLELQPKYPIHINGIHCFTYVGDFRYCRDGKSYTEDVKGFLTPIYRLKRKCVSAMYGIEIVEV